MKLTVNIVRIFVGVLFIISGLVKVNDPSGLAYKMDEYFSVWGWHWATDFSLALSIAMNIFEIVAGVALLLGWQSKTVTSLLVLLIIFFTFLTGYAVLSGKIKTCGCFGDCIPLQAHQSFIKDLILLVLTLFLYWKHKLIKPFLPIRANLFLLLFSLGLVYWAQIHVLKNLPWMDCLPYAKGNNLLEKMQPPPGSVPDSTAVFYKYKVDGKEIEFEASNFPEDFDEERYEYISRENKIVRKGNATPAIQDMAFFTQSGTDTTKALLNSGKPYIMVFARDFNGKQPEWYETFTKIFSKANEENIAIMLVSNVPDQVNDFFNKQKNFKANVLTCDGTVMKTMLRTKNGIIAMNGPVVKGKWSEANMNDIVKFMNEKGFDQ
ncbi:MAG: DoxX family protein [Chitinophagaceae bacterium]|nr:DoxX family protein [Chitinophagaceae bacterium]